MGQVHLTLYNVLYDESEGDSPKAWESDVQIDGQTTLQTLVGLADLSSYYPLSGVFSFNNQYVPYVLHDDTVLWNQGYESVLVEDFLTTHQLMDRRIEATGGYAQAGGPGFLELAEIWESVYPVIDQFVTVAGAASIAAGTGRWIASLFRKKAVPPHSCFDLIFSRTSWNHFELSKLLRVTPDDAKRLLTSLAYRYDRRQMLFVQQPESLILKEKLSQVNVVDI